MRKSWRFLRCFLAGGIIGVVAVLAIAFLRTPTAEQRVIEAPPRLTMYSSGSGPAGLFSAAAKRAFLAGLTAEQRQRVIKLKSRWILPGKMFSQKDGSEQVFIQFEDWLSEAEKKKLAERGVKLGAPFTGPSYRAVLEPGAWQAVREDPRVEGIARVREADKLHEPLHEYVEGRPVPGMEDGGGVLVAVELVPGLEDSAREFVGRLVVRRPRRGSTDGEAVVRLSRDEIRRLALRDEVAYIHFLGYIPIETTFDEPDEGYSPEPDNETAQGRHNVDDLQGGSYNLDGSGIKVCEIDGGYVRNSHEALSGRMTLVEQDYGMSDHATHVAGTILGDPPTGQEAAEGMAPAAALWSYDYDNDLNNGDTMYPHEKLEHSVETYGCVTNNNSWSYVGGWNSGTWYGETIFGSYDWYARSWDLAVINKDIVVCKSAGNDRNDTGDGADPHDGTYYDTPGLANPYYDCIPNWGCSKNVITVGATDDSDVIATFSSTGPANDGRVKPDVVANGYGLYSSSSAGDSSYAWMSGTSMSSPVTAGITALIIQAYKNANGGQVPSAMLVKGLLVQTATDMWKAGPDYVYGFGLIDAKAAVDMLQADAAGTDHCRQESVSNGGTQEYNVFVPTGTTSWKVTLTWLDPAGSSGADPAIVHDLDLELVEPNGSTIHYPYKLNPSDPPAAATNGGRNSVDTVEQAVVSNPTAGTWKIRVKGCSIAGGSQDFVLLTGLQIGGLVAPNQLSPSGTIYEVLPTFSWDAVAVADSYKVEVGTPGGGIACRLDTSDTSAAHTFPLRIGQEYRWKVRAVAAGGTLGPWSGYLNFTPSPLPAPETTGDWGTIYTRLPTFTWDAVADATSYKVEVGVPGGGIACRLDAAGTSTAPGFPLRTGQSYRWRVRAVDAGGTLGIWSAYVDFTCSPLSAPETVSPSGTITETLPTFTWDAVAGAASYKAEVGTPSGGIACRLNAAGTSAAPGFPLRLWQPYRWRVRAVDAGGTLGVWSAYVDFVCEP